MTRERRGLFAGRRIDPLMPVKVLFVVVLAFAIGIGAGWVTALLPGVYSDLTSPEPSPSPSATPSPLPSLSVEPSPKPDITRDLDEQDSEAGIVGVDVPFRAGETFTSVPGIEESTETASATRWARIEIEDGLEVNSFTLSDFIMETLNDNRSWGSGNTLEFRRTDGVPNFRIVLASPRTAAALCSNPRSGLAPLVEASVTPEPEASSEAEEEVVKPTTTVGSSCAAEGLMVISLYDWTAGYKVYGDNRQDSRRYLLNHLTGAALGRGKEKCGGGLAEVMVNQTSMKDSCKVNPWPFPEADPSPSPEATSSE